MRAAGVEIAKRVRAEDMLKVAPSENDNDVLMPTRIDGERPAPTKGIAGTILLKASVTHAEQVGPLEAALGSVFASHVVLDSHVRPAGPDPTGLPPVAGRHRRSR